MLHTMSMAAWTIRLRMLVRPAPRWRRAGHNPEPPCILSLASSLATLTGRVDAMLACGSRGTVSERFELFELSAWVGTYIPSNTPIRPIKNPSYYVWQIEIGREG